MNIFFIDLDGTIEDSRLDMVAAVEQLRSEWQLPPRPKKELLPFVNRGMTQLYENCFDDAKKALSDIAQAYEATYAAGIRDQTKMYEGMEQALEKMSELGKIVLVTNKPEKLSQLLLKSLKIDKYFSVVMGGDSCAKCKPDPLPLQVAVGRLGLDDQPGHKWRSAFMIGDSAGDIAVAEAFGIPSVWCSWGYAVEPGAHPPSHRVSTPAELVPLLSQLIGPGAN